ncbi:MAG: hypothetical protein RBG1_1C00001G0396 [candidate division Zixibacteria bacterium RBG-1]|nr:MAG: hypothetical protein RBG1_1C00001G0396 [candidate division Zixibacteria bacterium RBG-1]OGC84796.1 MAG: undecaprenyldiphospho-muramoylpentapeptide beta-N-acetylglucosaminyltransferase [candidate division Zixibacteria bacterium RBG_19FT_COMBO_42_43]
MNKVILAGGGTGGHLFPAIAIAEGIKKKYSNSQVYFMGTKRGLEAKILPERGYKLFYLSVRGLKRGLNLSIFKVIFFLMKSMVESIKILRQIQPQAVIGTGGYVSAPAVLAASLMRIPTFIQEQNSFPGITTRILSLFAKKVFLAYDESQKYFWVKKKLKVTGNPVRPEIFKTDKTSAMKKFNLEQDKKTVLILGGSQGASSINNAVLEDLNSSAQELGFQVLWQTGEKDYQKIKENLEDSKNPVQIFNFIEDMSSAYAACDLVVSRAGAITLSEITGCGKPAILIPYPYATAGHQKYNAQVLEKNGAAIVIEEKNLQQVTLLSKTSDLLKDEQKLKQMSGNSKKLGRPNALTEILDEIEQILKSDQHEL